jgi:thiaminase/transcriptional activator TenA
VGKALERAGSPDPLYARWIGTYASKEFGGLVRAVLGAAETTAARLQPAELNAMRRRFLVASRYEWMFWEMGYGREGWPL